MKTRKPRAKGAPSGSAKGGNTKRATKVGASAQPQRLGGASGPNSSGAPLSQTASSGLGFRFDSIQPPDPPKVPNVFDGKYSEPMWSAINNARTVSMLREALYFVCCRLQEFESKVERERGVCPTCGRPAAPLVAR